MVRLGLAGLAALGASAAMPIGAAHAQLTDTRQNDLNLFARSSEPKVGLELVIPFGGHAQHRKLEQAPRIGLFFGQDMPVPGKQGPTNRSSAMGFTFDGRGYGRLSDTVFAFSEYDILFGADASDDTSARNNNRGLIIGLIVVGSGALLAHNVWEVEEDVSNTTEDIINCIVGVEECPSDSEG